MIQFKNVNSSIGLGLEISPNGFFLFRVGPKSKGFSVLVLRPTPPTSWFDWLPILLISFSSAVLRTAIFPRIRLLTVTSNLS